MNDRIGPLGMLWRGAVLALVLLALPLIVLL